MTQKLAWLIERSGLPLGPVYLTVATYEWRFEWTTDPSHALQYATKEEAERAWADASRGQPAGDAMSDARIRITEHEWESMEALPKPKRAMRRSPAIALLHAHGVYHGDRSRNYELETALQKLPGEFSNFDWWIDDPCPFNGRFSRWGEEHTDSASTDPEKKDPRP